MTIHVHLHRFREKPFVSALPKLKIYPLSEKNQVSNQGDALASRFESSVIAGFKM